MTFSSNSALEHRSNVIFRRIIVIAHTNDYSTALPPGPLSDCELGCPVGFALLSYIEERQFLVTAFSSMYDTC